MINFQNYKYIIVSSGTYSRVIKATWIITLKNSDTGPQTYALNQGFSNTFNPTIIIQNEFPKSINYSLKVYNL